jgi:hypothetical protein
MQRIAMVALATGFLLAPLRATPVAAQLSAEPWFRAGTLMITAEVGGAAFSDFQRAQARPLDDQLGLSSFDRRVSAQTAGSAGAWLEYWLFDGIGIRTGFSYTPTRFAVWNAEPARARLEEIAPDATDPSYAALDVWLAHAAAVFRVPHSFGRVSPYLIGGVGLIRYSASTDAALPAEARATFVSRQRDSLAGMLGVGAAIPLQRKNLLMSFELTNHLARSPLPSGSGGEMFDLAGVAMQLEPGARDDEIGLTSHLRLSLGVTLPIR